MPSAQQRRPAAEQTPDRRRAVWVAQLLTERAFRAEQIEQLDRDVTSSSAPARDTITKTLRDNAQAALREIDAALGRLLTGGFGRCLTCGQAIDPVRLDVLPMAGRCTACQYEAERS